MANPGLTFNAQLVNGLVEEIDWGEWGIDEQEAHAFGSEGTSSIQGALVKRDFSVPFIIYGYATQLLRDAAVLTLEKMAGQVGALELRVGGGTVIFTQSANIKLVRLKRGKSGVDANHSNWRMLTFTFRQLASS